jgi:hypothetical protein
VVIKIARQSVVSNLFQDDKETLDQILVFSWFGLASINEVIQGSGHHTWVFIAEGSFHLHIKLVDWQNLIKLHHDNDSFFPNHLILMRKQLVDCISERHDNLLIDELGEHGECREHLQMRFGLQISLKSGNHQDYKVRTCVDKKGARQIANALNK